MSQTYTAWTRERACGAKRQWPHPKAAKAAARESAAAYGEPRENWNHYRCSHCHYWHIGHIGSTT